jgi:hypothetical protein
MEHPKQTGTSENNPQFQDKGQKPAPGPNQRTTGNDRWSELMGPTRANSMPANNFNNFKKNDAGANEEGRGINVSNLSRNQTVPRDLNLMERSRVNTNPDAVGPSTLSGVRRFTEDQNRSRFGEAGKRSILELQQSWLNPAFRRMTNRMSSQAKIHNYKTVKSQRVYPESLIYKIKKITMTRKLDPEVGKIKLRVEEHGNQELTKFPKQVVPVRKNIIDIPSSISSYKTLSRNPSRNDLNSRLSRSNKPEIRLPNSTNRQDSRSTHTNLLSPANLLIDDSNKFDFANDPEISPRIRINETVDENNQRSNTFGINPVPVIPLKPTIGLPTPTGFTRNSFSQDKKLVQPHRQTSVEKEEKIIARTPANDSPMETKLNTFRRQLKSPEASQNMKSLLESKDYSNIEASKLNNQNFERSASPPNRMMPKGKTNQSSIMITESNLPNQPNISQSEVIPLSMQPQKNESNNQTLEDLIASPDDNVENLLVSNVDKNFDESNALDLNLDDQSKQLTDEPQEKSRVSSENNNDGDIEDEENDIVPKIDFLKKFKGKDDFSTIHETEEENHSISSKFGTELHFGTKGPGNIEKAKPSAVNNKPLKTSNEKRDSNPTMTEFNTNSGYSSSKQTIMAEARNYGTEVPNVSVESDTKFVARRTMTPLTNRGIDVAPRFSQPVSDKNEKLTFNNAGDELDALQIETSTEKIDESQDYLANESHTPDEKAEPNGVVEANPSIANKLKPKGSENKDLVDSEITVQTDQADDTEHDLHTNNDIDAYLQGIHESAHHRNNDSLPTISDNHRGSLPTDIETPINQSIKPTTPLELTASNMKKGIDEKSNVVEEPEPINETVVIPSIPPADFMVISSNEKCKDIVTVPTVAPEAIWSHKTDSDHLREIMAHQSLAPIQVFYFKEGPKDSDGLRPTTPNISIPPSETTSVNQPTQQINPPVIAINQPPATNMANNTEKNDHPQKNGGDTPGFLALPKTDDSKNKQPLLSPNSGSQVFRARSVDINPQPQQSNVSSNPKISSRRDVKDDLTPVESLRRKSALKNPALQKRFEQTFFPEPKYLNNKKFNESVDSPITSKMSIDNQKYHKENIRSDRNYNMDDDNKRVGWAVNNLNTVIQRPVTKGQRTRIDVEPAFGETPPQSQKISQKFVKFTQEPEEDDSYNSMSYQTLEDSLAKPLKNGDQDIVSIANTSLIKLDNEQLKILSKRNTNALNIYVNTLKDKKKVQPAKMLGGLCCMFFFLSSILWIVLLKILHDKNSFLSNIIMYPPTLGLYHQVYTEFFLNYDRNYEIFQDANKNLNQQIFPSYHKKMQALKEVSDLKTDNSIAMLGIKKYLADLVDRLPSQQALKSNPEERRLHGSSGSAVAMSGGGSTRAELLPSNAITRVLKRLEAAKDQIKKHRFNREEMEAYLADIQNKSHEMYERCIELVDNFGRFFIMTNRIWSTTENIFRFYQSKAKEVIDEMTMEHYRQHSHFRKDIRLLNLHHKTWAKLIDFPIIKIRSERKILLMCSIQAQVYDPELKYINQAFDFYLDWDSSIQSSKQNFEQRLDREKQSVMIQQMLEVPPGMHDVELYGIITGKEIFFKQLKVDCIEHLEYQNIPEFRK